MLRPRANEISELIQRLGSRKRSCVDAARARLALIGQRAVDDLIGALDDDDVRIRAKVMPLLALIQDPRGREPVTAMLLDRNARLRAIAAQCLARFPNRETVATLARVFERERARSVRTAAARALVELCAAGHEGAVAPLLERLGAIDEMTAVRLACFALLEHLPAGERRGLLRGLKQDPAEEIRTHAVEMETRRREPVSLADCEVLLRELGSADYAAWHRAVQWLGAAGAPVVAPLLAEMQGRAHDPEYCTRAGMALKAMGPRRCRSLADALGHMDEPLPLQVLVEVIGSMGDKSQIYRLKELIERLSERPSSPAEANGLDPMQRVVAKAHLELARIGSRVAIRQLRDALTDSERRIEPELLAAVERIGKREEIAILLRAWAREDVFIRERLKDSVRAIMKRERIRRNNRFFQTLGADQRKALAAILPPREASRRPKRASSSRRRPAPAASA